MIKLWSAWASCFEKLSVCFFKGNKWHVTAQQKINVDVSSMSDHLQEIRSIQSCNIAYVVLSVVKRHFQGKITHSQILQGKITLRAYEKYLTKSHVSLSLDLPRLTSVGRILFIALCLRLVLAHRCYSWLICESIRPRRAGNTGLILGDKIPCENWKSYDLLSSRLFIIKF